MGVEAGKPLVQFAEVLRPQNILQASTRHCVISKDPVHLMLLRTKENSGYLKAFLFLCKVVAPLAKKKKKNRNLNFFYFFCLFVSKSVLPTHQDLQALSPKMMEKVT